MGPVGQIVKILFCMILAMELAFSVAIYTMATILLCSRILLPESILLHGSIALFLSIVTLSVIHRGFQAVAHDCPFHLYWFAIILVALLLIQFLLEMFGIRSTSSNVWYQQHSMPIQDISSRKFDLDESVENLPVSGPDKSAYRVPTPEELEAHKKHLYGETNKTEKHKSRWNHRNKTSSEREPEIDHEELPPHRKKYGSRRKCDENGEKCEEKKVLRKGRDGEETNESTTTEKPAQKQPASETDEKLTKTPMVLLFHGYSFILKMACVALSVLTGFMYQLEYI